MRLVQVCGDASGNEERVKIAICAASKREGSNRSSNSNISRKCTRCKRLYARPLLFLSLFPVAAEFVCVLRHPRLVIEALLLGREVGRRLRTQKCIFFG